MASKKQLARRMHRSAIANGGLAPTEDEIEDRLAIADELTREAERLGLYEDDDEYVD